MSLQNFKKLSLALKTRWLPLSISILVFLSKNDLQRPPANFADSNISKSIFSFTAETADESPERPAPIIYNFFLIIFTSLKILEKFEIYLKDLI